LPVDVDSRFLKEGWAPRRGVQTDVKGAILAAGLGRRMDPLTVSHLPKPMFPLGGRTPMLELWVRGFVDSGITDVSMNLCVLPDTIRGHFGSGSKFAASIRYLEESIPSGTLGGVCKQALGGQAKKVLPDEGDSPLEPFSGSTLIVPSGDIVANFGAELLEEAYDLHKRSGSAFSMILVPVPWARRRDFGTAVLDRPADHKGLLSSVGKVIEFREKDPASPSNLNNASIYFIEMELLRTLDAYRTPARAEEENPFYDFGKHVFPALLGQIPYVSLPKKFQLLGFQYDGTWFDVGQKRDYLRVNEALLDGKIHLELPYEKFPWGFCGSHSTVNFEKATIIPPVVIGDHCVIEAGATIGPYAIIGDDWIIERGARIQHSVLWGRYPFFTADGRKVGVEEGQLVDRHEVRKDSVVEECIVVGGTVAGHQREKTIDLLENGDLDVISIDHIPDGSRA
jgi:NDP-sugar pyrophosphorylase family protein